MGTRGKSDGAVKYRGVSKKRDKYQMSYPYGGKYIYGGLFKSAEEAARQYDQAVISLYGDDAPTNQSLGLFDGDNAHNPYEVEDDVVYVYLPDGNVLVVDRDDHDAVKEHYWYTMGRVIVAWDGERHLNLARYLTNPEDGEIVVHSDGDRFNNRRENLEVTTVSEWNRNRLRV